MGAIAVTDNDLSKRNLIFYTRPYTLIINILLLQVYRPSQVFQDSDLTYRTNKDYTDDI